MYDSNAPRGLYSSPVPVNTAWSQHVFILSIIMPILATLVVIMRVVARRMKDVKLGPDDWLVFGALIVYYFHSVITLLTTVIGGAGHHINTLEPSVLTLQLKLLMGVQIAYAIVLGLVKCSVCLLLMRIFSVHTSFIITMKIILAVTIAWALMTVLVALSSCTPFSYNWNKEQHGHCGNLSAAFAAIAAIDIAVDVAILISPIPQVWRLQMPLTTKIALVSVFALGLFDLAMGALRIVFDVRVHFSGDWTYNIAALYFWSSMEPGLAIIVSCAPVLRPLLEKFLPARFLGIASRSKGYKMRSYTNITNDEGRQLSIGYPRSSTVINTAASYRFSTGATLLTSSNATSSEVEWPLPDSQASQFSIMTHAMENNDERAVIGIQKDISVEREIMSESRG